MAAKERTKQPEVFIKGIDEVIKKDLGKHKELLVQTRAELESFQQAVSHESEKKRYYYRQIGQGKYNDDSLRASVKDIRINIRHLSDKVKLSLEKIEHHRLIIDTLTAQLAEYNERYAALH